MPRVVVNTQNYMFADMIKRTLESGDFSVTIVDKPEKLLPEFNRTAANIVLMEVTGYTPWKIEERMKLRGQIRQKDPERADRLATLHVLNTMENVKRHKIEEIVEEQEDLNGKD